jgi:hypothetical protein
MQTTATIHVEALFRVLSYCSVTLEQRLVLKQNRSWDGNPEFELSVRDSLMLTMQQIHPTEEV